MVMLRRLWIQITSDRKRFGILCAMLALGLLLWGRIIVTSNLPRTAMANGDDPNLLLPPDPGPGSSDKPLGPPVKVTLARQPRRDPFLISDEHFPKPTPVEVLPQDGSKSGGNATENTNRTDERLTRELRALVDRFKLTAVMQGRPMAVINGKSYRLYSWIQAVGNDEYRFQLVEVGDRSVVLEYEGRRFRLRMVFPGNEER
ncbi:MAG: hypothetical protein ACYS0J_04855 [Planctomycetota bacterium]|jgi:hypothetical protein